MTRRAEALTLTEGIHAVEAARHWGEDRQARKERLQSLSADTEGQTRTERSRTYGSTSLGRLAVVATESSR